MAQSKTAVNAKAASAEAPHKLETSVVPGQEIQDLGGPTPQDYKPEGESAKLDAGKGAAESKTVVNAKAGKKDEKPSVSPSVLPGNEGPGATGNSNPGPEKLGKQASYEHVEIDAAAAAHLEELAEAQGADDEFTLKAKVIFEGALHQKLQLETARLEEEFSARFEQEISEIAEKVEAFLNYTSEQWLEENKLVVENGIRNELSESFMSGLKGLFEDHYVALPDEKYDIFESMVAKLDDMEDKLNEQIEANVALNSQMGGFQRAGVLADVSWDLSETAKEKLAGLAESVEFESEASFRQKLNILKESFVESAAPVASESAEILSESAEALAPTAEEGMSASMAAYVRSMGRSLR
ncbi:prohead assembly (scaffolding) protein [Synechococcus phage S-N03]|uniref:Prohead assembly (Scaffolding) protein n=1 Tax=Synechococcus phage S-N03 TaxID=2718943 RepID=A0A6G8R648_9CAUD|nr:head scaffolding protein [Synechococcus phage S-N03]QIN96854.1 prohead assembly (scaffolding) protein [Synechococcus phage S-N03]